MASSKNYTFVGNGDFKKITDCSNHIFINTSFGRVNSLDDYYFIETLFMADGYTDLKQVTDAKPIPGHTQEESQKIRSDKIALYSKVTSKEIILISNRSRINVEKGLLSLGIKYQKLKIISIRKIYWLCLKVGIKAGGIELSMLISWIKSIITNFKPLPAYRPSTSFAAMLIFNASLNYTTSFKLTGILKENSFYGKNLSKVNFKNIHEKTDLYLLKGLKSYRNITMET